MQKAGWDQKSSKLSLNSSTLQVSALGILSQNYDPETNEVSFGLCCLARERAGLCVQIDELKEIKCPPFGLGNRA
jgi:hypothetical protein